MIGPAHAKSPARKAKPALADFHHAAREDLFLRDSPPALSAKTIIRIAKATSDSARSRVRPHHRADRDPPDSLRHAHTLFRQHAMKCNE